MKWYEDPAVVRDLPLRYRAYAGYSRLFGAKESRRVPGGSFMLRVIRDASALFGVDTIVPVHGIDGLTVMADFADERILDVIHEIRGENPEYRVMREILGEGDTFVDVGANFGTFSLLASRLVGESGSVIAIEPQPRLAGLIERSLMLSGVSNCRIVNMACGTTKERRTLLVPVDDSGRAGFFRGFSGVKPHEEIEVEVSTLDQILSGVELSGRVFIKIDVEGSELDVLAGGEQTIASRRPAIMIEINRWSAEAAGKTAKEVVDRLRQPGYRSLASVEHFPETIEPADIPLERQINLIATG